jgi:SNF2 family DNA or RNA helicase
LEEAVVRRKEKVVLWSFYTASIEAAVARFARFNPVRYDGTVSDIAVRREGVRRFQEDDETILFIANPAAAGAGITLHRARLAVYESMSNQAAHYLQSLDRIHRRGQTRDVEYIVLLCDQTIELAEYARLTTSRRRCCWTSLIPRISTCPRSWPAAPATTSSRGTNRTWLA